MNWELLYAAAQTTAWMAVLSSWAFVVLRYPFETPTERLRRQQHTADNTEYEERMNRIMQGIDWEGKE